ncbi:MAG: hypothetical protein KJ626_03330 [Verrucomicrobia bacterium]|nr:hypothetical protein [Verrucomicrobiota bacterium]
MEESGLDALTLLVDAFQVPHDEEGRDMFRRKLLGLDHKTDLPSPVDPHSSHKVQKRLLWLCLIVILAYLVAVPGPTYRTCYRSVLDPATGTPTVVYRTEYPREGKEKFLLHEGGLYLEVERVRPGAIFKFVKYRFSTQWTSATVWQFRENHTVLEEYWPDPESENGGVSWISGAPPKP